MGRKKDPELVRRDRVNRWILLKENGHCGWRVCFRKGCGQFAYCQGKTYERMSCYECFLEKG